MKKKEGTTKKDYYAMLEEIVDSAEDLENKEELLSFIDRQVAALDAKAEKAKERAAEKRANGDELRDVIQSILTNEYQTIDTIVSQISGEDVTRAKVTSRLTALTKAGVVEKSEVRNEETGRAQKTYRLV